MKLYSHVTDILPGAIVLVAGAFFSFLIADFANFLQPLIVAVAVGVLIGNLIGVPPAFAHGVGLHKLCLETGIVLLGAAIVVQEFLAAGPIVFLIIICVVFGGLLFAEGVARLVFSLEGDAPSLLAAGASICGVSAVVAIGRVLDSRATSLTFAIATILLFDAITLVIFPIAGEWFDLSARQFGVWAGVSMFSTGPVAAAGFAHSAEAGQWATVTKLTRNSLLGAVAIAYSVAYTARSATEPGVRRLWIEFPKFLLGFLIVAAIANTGVLSSAAIDSIGTISEVLFALAFVGLGASIRLREMRAVETAAVGVVLIHLLVVSAVSLVAVRVLL